MVRSSKGICESGTRLGSANGATEVRPGVFRYTDSKSNALTPRREQHGYSRAAFYLISAAFGEAGMRGLLDERRGRRGPLKLTPGVVAFLAAADRTVSGAELAAEIERRFGVSLHRRTIERAR